VEHNDFKYVIYKDTLKIWFEITVIIITNKWGGKIKSDFNLIKKRKYQANYLCEKSHTERS